VLENNQVHVFSLSLSELLREPALESLSDMYHGAGVTGLDTCIRKSLIVTCSTDRTIRIWNYKQNSNELTKYFPEEAYSIAFHPSGYRIFFCFF
jgi:WD40 repeat protein